jgi:hypothetical protein
MMGAIFLVLLFLLYFMPSIVACSNKHHQAGAIFVLNLLLGWTFVGWVVAAVWCSTKPAKQPTIIIRDERPRRGRR